MVMVKIINIEFLAQISIILKQNARFEHFLQNIKYRHEFHWILQQILGQKRAFLLYCNLYYSQIRIYKNAKFSLSGSSFLNISCSSKIPYIDSSMDQKDLKFGVKSNEIHADILYFEENIQNGHFASK